MFYDQIRFTNYQDKTAPKEYWAYIQSIAEIISWGLSSGGIEVLQYKEKFGEVRVYVDFSTVKKEKLIKQYQHYRYVYLKIMSMFPQYNSAIFSGADYSYLLFQSKEYFDKEIEEMDENHKKFYLDKFDFIKEVAEW